MNSAKLSFALCGFVSVANQFYVINYLGYFKSGKKSQSSLLDYLWQIRENPLKYDRISYIMQFSLHLFC